MRSRGGEYRYFNSFNTIKGLSFLEAKPNEILEVQLIEQGSENVFKAFFLVHFFLIEIIPQNGNLPH